MSVSRYLSVFLFSLLFCFVFVFFHFKCLCVVYLSARVSIYLHNYISAYVYVTLYKSVQPKTVQILN